MFPFVVMTFEPVSFTKRFEPTVNVTELKDVFAIEEFPAVTKVDALTVFEPDTGP